MRNMFKATLIASALVFGNAGCEILTGIDRDKIPTGQGGSGGRESSSSSSSGVAGKGGAGGAAGAGGMAGAAGAGGMAGAGGKGGAGGAAGTGGTGGAAGSAGMGGAAGAGGGGMGGSGGGMPCTTTADCPVPPTCVNATCVGNVCGTSPVAAGTKVGDPTIGDCHHDACDGAGQVASVIDDADVPDDMKDCTSNVCTNGVPSNPPLIMGAACGMSMNMVCNGTGSCVGCNAPTDCAGGPDTTCHTRTCTANVCGVTFAPMGTFDSDPMVGDCHENQCDGAGNSVSVPSATDVPNDSNTCTSDVCMAGVPSNPPVNSGTTCNQNGGSVCNGAGACVQCVAASTCPGVDTECRVRTCAAGMCGFSNISAGTQTAMQTTGDCQKNQCDGNGNIVSVADNADLPVDGNTCTNDVCMSGMPSNPPVMSGTMCGSNGLCNATGQCVGCLMPSDCPGQDTECQTRTCTAGVCGFSNTAAGTPVAMQTDGDCKTNQCNGMGSVTVAINNSDVPIDNNQCTSDVCTAGTPSNPPTGSGATCNQSGGSVCNGAGACVQCVVASTCPGTDTECQTRTCAGNMCGFNFAANGTPVASQTPGDCKKNQCNGSGAIVNVNDNADVPVDNLECTNDVCTNGVPSNPAEAADTACTQNGGAFCDGAGACVQCNAATQCAGMDTECQTRTCSAHVCGFNFTANGTPVASQTPGDCKQNQCNGAGAIVTVTNNADLPVDNIQCTSDVCTNGVPSNPALAVDTACTQNGGAFCDGAGACVQCNAATQCAGMDTECQTRTCSAHTCGVNNTASGTPVAGQTPGDCKQNQCDGAGAIVTVANNADVPVDNNDCTGDVCTAGVPSNPDLAADTMCSQAGGAVCNGAGSCVACNNASQCPGVDNECQTRTCNGNVCGFNYTASGTPVASQTAGDCKKNQCDGAGSVVTVNDNADLPNDNNQCTSDVCTNGVPSNPALVLDAACNQNGGSFCDGLGTCVQCNAATQCAGVDTECQTRTCAAHTCGFSYTPNGTPIMSQTAGDCQQVQCDGTGAVVSVAFNSDVPVDNNQCTSDVCVNGVPTNPALVLDAPCSQNGGSYCNGLGTCVQCNSAAQCSGTDTECQTRTCAANTCGFNYTANGTPVSSQMPGDCKQNQCNGSGSVVTVNDNADVLVDNNQCTSDVCTAGVPSNPAVPLGTMCSQGGGTLCDNTPTCTNAPTVVSTTPANSSTPIASNSIAVTFSTAMTPATLTANATAGACVGNLQVSLDNFTSCIAFSGSVMSPDNKTVTLTAAPGLLVNRLYKIRVTTGATGATGLPLATQFDMANGFTTTSPNLCNGSVVISQVYGGGGNSGATYNQDFVELHNRGTTPATITGWSLQYASAAGNSWSVAALPGASIVIPAGGYYLVATSTASMVNGVALPTVDNTATGIAMATAAGKIALVNNTTALAGTCPTGASIVDFVGYGSQVVATGCWEGNPSVVQTAPAPSVTNSDIRVATATSCADVNNNADDFQALAVAPRNGATPVSMCQCVIQNESNTALEADYCNVQSPLSLTIAAGGTTGAIFGRVFEAGVTPTGGAQPNVRAQLGWGTPTTNPQYNPTWTWTNATFNVQVGNDDEYQASFTAPSSGSYRYVYRYSVDSGVSWTVCDKNAGDFGAGSNVGLTFEFADMPVLTVP